MKYYTQTQHFKKNKATIDVGFEEIVDNIDRRIER